jgi:hypothetical protein
MTSLAALHTHRTFCGMIPPSNETMDSLQAIQDASNLPDLTQMVSEDVMGMIDQGRNPDIHTRSFTNRLIGDNQQMRGQANNLDVGGILFFSLCMLRHMLTLPFSITQRYRNRLRAKIEAAFPEMKSELEAMDMVA